jgi:hypothetical protein
VQLKCRNFCGHDGRLFLFRKIKLSSKDPGWCRRNFPCDDMARRWTRWQCQGGINSSLLDQGEFRRTPMKMRPCKDNRMNQNEAEELDSKDGDPDRPEEIGNEPGPPRVEYWHCTTSTHQRTQGGGGCSKLDASLGRRPSQTGNGFCSSDALQKSRAKSL